MTMPRILLPVLAACAALLLTASSNAPIAAQTARAGVSNAVTGEGLPNPAFTAGWFTPLADTNHVQLIRIVAAGKSGRLGQLCFAAD